MTGWDPDWVVGKLIEHPPWCEKCRIPMVVVRERREAEGDPVEIRFDCLNFGCGRRHVAVVDPGRRLVQWDNQETGS